MALENRDLKAGQKLVARYKGQEHTVLVLGDDKDGSASNWTARRSSSRSRPPGTRSPAGA